MTLAVIFLIILGIYYLLNTNKDYVSGKRTLKDPNRVKYFSSVSEILDGVIEKILFTWAWYIKVPLFILLFWWVFHFVNCYIFFGWAMGEC
mgnify:CR=1 FL=1